MIRERFAVNFIFTSGFKPANEVKASGGVDFKKSYRALVLFHAFFFKAFYRGFFSIY